MMSIVMSSPQQITPLLADLAQYIHAPRGKELLSEVNRAIGALDRKACYDLVCQLPTSEQADRLESLTSDQFTPYPGQDIAFRTDMKRFFVLLRMGIEGNHETSVTDLLETYVGLFPFSGRAKERCGALRSTCIMSTENNEHRFESADQLICPVCGTPRALCHKAPRSNGRCGSHGGRAASSTRMSRGMIYREHITDPESVRAMEQIEQDAEAISLIPEIGLLTTRVTNLIDQIEQGVDAKSMLKQLQDISKRANNALSRDDPEKALAEIERAIYLFDNRGRADRLWSEVLETVKVLGTQTDRERKRIAMEKQMIPIERAIRLQDETVEQIQIALGRASGRLAGRFIYLIETQILPGLPVPERTAETIVNGLHDRRRVLSDSILSIYEAEIDKFMAEREENLNQTLPASVTIPELPPSVFEGDYADD